MSHVSRKSSRSRSKSRSQPQSKSRSRTQSRPQPQSSPSPLSRSAKIKRVIKLIGVAGLATLVLFLTIHKFDSTTYEPYLRELRMQVDKLMRRLEGKLSEREMVNIKSMLDIDEKHAAGVESWGFQQKWKKTLSTKSLENLTAEESAEIRKDLKNINRLAQFLKIRENRSKKFALSKTHRNISSVHPNAFVSDYEW